MAEPVGSGAQAGFQLAFYGGVEGNAGFVRGVLQPFQPGCHFADNLRPWQWGVAVEALGRGVDRPQRDSDCGAALAAGQAHAGDGLDR